MSAGNKNEIQPEIAHVLFIDIVGYSKLSINEQHAAVDESTQIVRDTGEFKKADATQRLIKIATGDGMALVFYTSPEGPVRCAIEEQRRLAPNSPIKPSKRRPKVEPASGTARASPSSSKVAEIDPPRESEPTLLTIDPSGVGEKLGVMPVSLETPSTLETSGKKLTAFPRLEFPGSIQSTLRPVEPKLTVVGSVTSH
jgi:hypothetical protein